LAFENQDYKLAMTELMSEGITNVHSFAQEYKETIKSAIEEANKPFELNPMDVEILKVSTSATSACPGQKVPIEVSIKLRSGQIVLPFWDGEQGGRFDPELLLGESSSGQLRGLAFYPDWNPLAGFHNGYEFTVSLAGAPGSDTSFSLPPSYDCVESSLGFSGGSGRIGDSGLSGDSYSSGYTSGNGQPEHGEPGEPGQDGTDAGAGPAVTVHVGYTSSKFHNQLLVAKAVSGNSVNWYIGPANRTLNLFATGGAGGDGGDGGSGGDGSPEINGTSSYEASGRGADGADGGHGANGGRGGALTVWYDSKHPGLAKLLSLSTSGGRAGYAGNSGRGGTGGSQNGEDGRDGRDGRSGQSGAAGSAPTLRASSRSSLFKGDDIP
jgi:hypothetical protein